MISVEAKGLDRLLRRIDSLSDVDGKLLEVARRLCEEIGEPIIKATHDGHGTNKVWSEQIANGYSVVADGDKVLFVEFGTGNATGAEADKYVAVPSVVYAGSWSEAHEGEYWRTGGKNGGYWHFGGRKYTETPPHPAFYEAYEAMVKALPRIAKEVFGG